MTAYIVETLVVLAAMALLGVMVVTGGRRLGMGRGRGPIELAGYLPLDARRAVYLIRVGEQVLVVGASEAGLTRIGETERSKLPAEVERPRSFAALLLGGRRSGSAPSAGGT